jgi:hypothetical protein
VRRPSITDHVVTSRGRGARKRQPIWPTGRAPPSARTPAGAPRCGSVRPDHEIVRAARSVAEADGDRAVARSDALDGQPHSDRHLTRRLAEERVQLAPMHREARPDGCPQSATSTSHSSLPWWS